MHAIQSHTLKTQTNQHRRTQDGVLFPTLFNIYTSDISLPLKDVQITTYSDDITITASHNRHRKARQLIQSYLYKKQAMIGSTLKIFI